MVHDGYILEDHALRCDTCYKWALGPDEENAGDEPACRTGQEIRQEIRTLHRIGYQTVKQYQETH